MSRLNGLKSLFNSQSHLLKTIILVLGGGVLSIPLFSAERLEYYNGVRSLGMGGARIAVVNDETALLINPAGLGKLRNMFLTLVDPELEFGGETQSIIESDVGAFLNAQTTLDLVEANPGKYFHQRAQLFPSFVVPNFGIGVYAKYSMDAKVDGTTTTEYDMTYRNDYAVVAGFDFRFLDGRLKFGFNARATNRVEIITDAGDSTRTDLTISSEASEGFGVGSDLGMILSMPWMWLPTLAVVLRDSGNTHFSVNDGLFLSATTRPTTVLQTLDASVAIFPVANNSNRFTFAAEMRDVLDAYEEKDSMKRIHAGIEYNLSDAFFLRAGLHQRYWSAGVELSMFRYQLQFATYGEEIGTDTANLEDRRYVAKFAFRF